MRNQFMVHGFYYELRTMNYSGSDIPLSDGVFHDVGGFSEHQFVHDVGSVMVDGTRADTKNFSNLPRRFPLRYQLEDLSFTGGQASVFATVSCISSALQPPVRGKLLREGRRSVDPPLPDLSYGGEEFGVCVLLQEKAVCAQRERLVQILLVPVHGEDQHFHPGVPGFNLAHGFKAAQLRHRDIENNHVGGRFVQELNEFDAVTRFSDNLEFWRFLDNASQPLAKQCVIVSQGDAIRTHGSMSPYVTGCGAGCPCREASGETGIVSLADDFLIQGFFPVCRARPVHGNAERDTCAPSLLAPDRQGPSQHADPFLHAYPAQAPWLRIVGGRLRSPEPFSVVFNEDGDAPPAPSDDDLRATGTRMLHNIREGLLHDPVDIRLGVLGKEMADIFRIQGELNAVALH